MVKTSTYTYTKTRLSVIDDQFKLFFTCAGMSENVIERMLKAIEDHKLSAVGIYIEDGGFMIAEVSISIDWDEHNRIVIKTGNTMDSDIAGWKDGVAPEAYIPVQSLSKKAKAMGKSLRSWILVSEDYRRISTMHKAVCDELGYCYEAPSPSFKEKPVERNRKINGLEEMQVSSKYVSNY